MKLLTIGIPTIPDRTQQVSTLLKRLYVLAAPYLDEVEIQVHRTPRRTAGGPNIAQKRNELLKMANGLFCVQIDDDDNVSDDYFAEIIPVIKHHQSNIACVGHEIKVQHHRGKASLAAVSNRYNTWSSDLKVPGVPYRYTQSPYYKIPILTEIARKAKFDERKIWGEDWLWSMDLRPHLRGKPEVFIPKPLYIYSMPEAVNPQTRY